MKYEFDLLLKVTGTVEISNDINPEDITQEDIEKSIFVDNEFPEELIAPLFTEKVRVDDFYPNEVYWDKIEEDSKNEKVFNVCIEETQSQTFKVLAKDAEDAYEKATSAYENGDIYLDDPQLEVKSISVEDKNGEWSEFTEF